MTQLKWEIEFYHKPNGRCPTETFLDTLPKDDLLRIINHFDRLGIYGTKLDRPYVAHLRDGIWELRSQVHRVQYRFFYFFWDGQKFVITHGVKKKKNKVDNADIEQAIRFREDYFNRFGGGG